MLCIGFILVKYLWSLVVVGEGGKDNKWGLFVILVWVYSWGWDEVMIIVVVVMVKGVDW